MEVCPIRPDQGELRLCCLLQQREESLHGRLHVPGCHDHRADFFVQLTPELPVIIIRSTVAADALRREVCLREGRWECQVLGPFRLTVDLLNDWVPARHALRWPFVQRVVWVLRALGHTPLRREGWLGCSAEPTRLCHCFRLRWIKSTADSLSPDVPLSPVVSGGDEVIRLFGYERGRGTAALADDGAGRNYVRPGLVAHHAPTWQYALVYPDRDLASDARGPTLRTQRLVLRRWRAEDLAPFAELNADPDVMAHMQKTMSREESDAFVARIEEEFDDCGFGLWAVEVPNHSPFIGFVGLHRVPFDAPFTPAVEVGWRLAREHWGYGFVTEAARSAVRYGLEEVGLDEIVSFTNPDNVRSWKVMERLGMIRDPSSDFEHPNVPTGHWLRTHIFYRFPPAAPSP